MFFTQYREYIKSRESLEDAYHVKKHKSELLFDILQKYTDAENLFNLYALDFNEIHFDTYKLKLDTLKSQLDSLSKVIDEDYSVDESMIALENKDRTAREFLSVKKNIEDLILHAQVELPNLNTLTNGIKTQSSTFSSDSLIQKLIADTTLITSFQDTLVIEKQNLFNRIFNAKADTLVGNIFIQQINQQWIDVVEKHVNSYIENYQLHQNKDLQNIQNTFLSFRKKERELIQYNDILLQHLKFGLDNLNRLERESIQISEQMALQIHEDNARLFGEQLRNSLIIMLFMLVLIVYFHKNSTLYEENLERERNYANQLAEEKTHILASISHEVRSPINSLQGTIDMLKKEYQKEHITPELLDSVSHEVQVIQNTVNDILSLSKIEAGKMEIKNSDINLHDFLIELINLHKFQANQKGIELKNNAQIPNNLLIHSNPFMLRQIITNLLGNAIKYTEIGEVELGAQILKKGNTKILEINVKDTGKGIEEKHIKNIFRQYYMTDPQASHQVSFGLGLYITKLLIEQLNGKIQVKSELNKGTTFTVLIPIETKTLDTFENFDYLNEVKKWNVIIFDDNKVNLLHIEQSLKNVGFKNIKSVLNSKNLQESIQNEEFDLVLTDLLMPNMSGWDLLSLFKQKSSNTIVIAITSDPDLIYNTDQSREYEFDGVLEKPLKTHDLKNLLLNLRKAE